MPRNEPHIEAARVFVKTNCKLERGVSRGDLKVLVEGHVAEYGPNYMFRTTLAAKAVEKAVGGADVVDGF